MEQRAAADQIDRTLEEIRIQGHSTVEGVISPGECAEFHDQLMVLWAEQERESGRDRLIEPGEQGTHRGLLVERQ
jgi:hypothetical protein